MKKVAPSRVGNCRIWRIIAFNFIHITGVTDQGPTFGMPGYEVNLLYISILLALALGGPGAMSFDAKRRSGVSVSTK